MVDESEREMAGREQARAPQGQNRTELARLIEHELDRWMEHQRELQRNRRGRAAWNRSRGAQADG